MNANSSRIAVNGAAGRMGRQLLAAIAERDSATLAAAIDAPSSSAIGVDTSVLSGGDKQGIIVGDSASKVINDVDVFIDFTAPAVTLNLLEQLQGSDTAVVIGTTGFDDQSRWHCCSKPPRPWAMTMMWKCSKRIIGTRWMRHQEPHWRWAQQ